MVFRDLEDIVHMHGFYCPDICREIAKINAYINNEPFPVPTLQEFAGYSTYAYLKSGDELCYKMLSHSIRKYVIPKRKYGNYYGDPEPKLIYKNID